VKVLVQGAGSVGLSLAALLARRGHEVTVVARDSDAPTIEKKGIHLVGALGELDTPVTAVFTATQALPPGIFDLVLFTSRSYETREAARACKRTIGKHTLVVSLQNGLGNLEQIEEILGPRKLLGATCTLAAETIAPATVRISSAWNQLRVGEFRNHTPRELAAGLAQEFEQAGLDAVVSDDIRRDLWARLCLDAVIHPLAALLDAPAGELPKRDNAVVIITALVEEIFLVAHRLEIPLPWSDPQAFEKVLFQQLIPAHAQYRPAMLRDISQGKRTEIDGMNGYLVTLGRRHEISTPVNAYVTDLIEKKALIWRQSA